MRTLFSAFLVLISLTAAAAACPTIMEGRQSFSVSGQYLYTPRSYGVVAGGNQYLRNCGFNHTGYVVSQPDFSFYTSGMGGYGRLEVEVTSAACDTVLLVNSANGSWFFDDDSAGNMNPRVNLYGTSNTQGRIDVWVGTYGPSTCSATLEMETWYN
ncbi:hypothetical protein DZD18_08585 [Rhodobacteraceae bacterium W635]|uniref:hypothetical protein n=1 Tax=Nioella halotolerans TaxID=2303578 RepID=UPI000E3B92C0|nr:hypothetical protein DZD18_08585 [Rhodobacteraceae bacterium W635]